MVGIQMCNSFSINLRIFLLVFFHLHFYIIFYLDLIYTLLISLGYWTLNEQYFIMVLYSYSRPLQISITSHHRLSRHSVDLNMYKLSSQTQSQFVSRVILCKSSLLKEPTFYSLANGYKLLMSNSIVHSH